MNGQFYDQSEPVRSFPPLAAAIPIGLNPESQAMAVSHTHHDLGDLARGCEMQRIVSSSQITTLCSYVLALRGRVLGHRRAASEPPTYILSRTGERRQVEKYGATLRRRARRNVS